jgi:hypothetical protein
VAKDVAIFAVVAVVGDVVGNDETELSLGYFCTLQNCTQVVIRETLAVIFLLSF